LFASSFEHYGQKLVVDDVEYDMTLWDTAGQEDYERLRPLSYPHVSCFNFFIHRLDLIYIRVRTMAIFRKLLKAELPKPTNLTVLLNILLELYQSFLPFVLSKVFLFFLATKKDLRTDPSLACYTPEEGKKLKRRVKAQGYMECSALMNEGLEEVFIEAIRVFKKSKNKKPVARHCTVL
uniref:Ras-like GTP-binding protein RhoL n=1 Tax=Diabrotica virgifera virgifera TaxID=50390 RepID=A0A6P7GR30_DIAVI